MRPKSGVMDSVSAVNFARHTTSDIVGLMIPAHFHKVLTHGLWICSKGIWRISEWKSREEANLGLFGLQRGWLRGGVG